MLRRENELVMRFYFNSASKPTQTDAQHLPDIGTLKRSVTRFNADTETLEKSARDKKELYGIFGMIELPDAQYLILIEECTLLGQVLKANVFRVDKLLYVPLHPNPTYRASAEATKYIEMIENIANNKAFYFSYNVDLTIIFFFIYN